jgi:hypothetical protein
VVLAVRLNPDDNLWDLYAATEQSDVPSNTIANELPAPPKGSAGEDRIGRLRRQLRLLSAGRQHKSAQKRKSSPAERVAQSSSEKELDEVFNFSNQEPALEKRGVKTSAEIQKELATGL